MTARLWPVLAVACGTRAPVEVPPVPAPPIPAAPRPAVIEIEGLTLEGTPALDARLRRRRASERQAHHLLDLGALGALIASAEGCQLLARRGEPLRYEPCQTTWARLTRSSLIYEEDQADETSALRLGNQLLSPPGTIVSPLWDDRGQRAFYGLAGDQPAELWVAALTRAPRRIAGEGPWAPLDVSRDGRFVLARREVAFSRAGLYLIDVATGQATALTDPERLAGHARFAGDDVLAIVERDGQQVLEWISTYWRAPVARFAGDVLDFAVTARGIVALVDEAGLSSLELVEPTGVRRIAAAPENAVLGDLRTTATQLGFTSSSATHPRQVHVLSLETLKEVLAWPSARVDTPEPAIHEVVAEDGVRSSLLAYVPAGDRLPVILELHGGPEDRWVPAYDRWVDFATSEGFAVIRPNVRGSAGQGSAFAALDDGARRADVLRDIRAVLAWIAAHPALDASRVIVKGTSYGGYLALAALRAFPAQLRGGITLGALTDFVGFLEGTAPYRRDHRRAEYGDERDPVVRARLANLSPITWVGELRRPLLMAHGARDPRIPPETAARFVTAARAAGVPVWSIVGRDEGHWFEQAVHRQLFEVLALQFARATLTAPGSSTP